MEIKNIKSGINNTKLSHIFLIITISMSFIFIKEIIICFMILNNMNAENIQANNMFENIQNKDIFLLFSNIYCFAR